MSKFKDYLIEQQEQWFEEHWAVQDEYEMLDDYEYPDEVSEDIDERFNVELDEEGLPF
jgi:hypothetical protein